MPGNVALASPSTVFPNHLCSQMVQTISWEVRTTETYADGRSQRVALVNTNRNAWEIRKRLPLSEWQALLAFYEARGGAKEPFYWYPLMRDYDPTGASPTGRYAVRFEGSIDRNYLPVRQDIGLKLVEIS